MSSFTDEQIDSALRDDTLRTPTSLRVSRIDVYNAVSDRSNRVKKVKMIAITVLMMGFAIGAPVLEAATQPGPVTPPTVTYEAPGTTTAVTPLNSAAKATMKVQRSSNHSNSGNSRN